MPKGGFTKNNKSHENYLFKSKWNLGKTTVIRIPEILKDEFLHIAKYLDNKEKEKIQKINLVEELKGNITLDQVKDRARKFIYFERIFLAKIAL